MPAPLNEPKELAREAWFGLPPEKRTANNVIKAMKARGLAAPSKGSINRYAAEWKTEVEKTAEVFLPSQPIPRPAQESDDEQDGITRVLQDVLSPRLLKIAEGKGLDRVEDAVIKLADAIGSQAPKIAEMLLDTETETETVTAGGEAGSETTKKTEKARVARSAVTALTQLAQALHTVTAARSMVANAHLSFSQGDRFAAEANAIFEGGRADRAKEINPKGAQRPTGGLSAEEEAFAALRDTVGSKPKQ